MDVYLKKLTEILHSQYLNRYELASTLQAGISLISICNFHAYIYGAGKDIELFIRYFEIDKVHFMGIIDSDKKKQGKYICNIKVISPEEFIAKNDTKAYVFIYSLIEKGGSEEKKILSVLYRANIIDYCIVGNARYSIIACSSYETKIDEERWAYYNKEENKIIKFFNRLDDLESKEILLEYIRTFIECSIYRLENLQTRWKYFYGKDGEELYYHLKDEVWINFGASVGDTILLYFRNGLQAKKIYAIEGDKETAKRLKYNIKFLPDQIKNKIEVIEHFVKNDDFFKDFFDEKISLINCDIEGEELEMLHQMRGVIEKYRPVLAICLYHKKEDIIEIPEFIDSIVNNYFFKLRKYIPYIGNKKEN